MISRRVLLKAAVAAPAAAVLPVRANPSPPSWFRGLNESALIYLSPLKRDGSESRCQAEVWFVFDGTDIFVCSKKDTWRARAAGKGLKNARIWVGDLGPWKGTDGEYRKLPNLEAEVSRVTEASVLDGILDRFGDKYALEWLLWGPRFRNGLADGSRVMLRYHPGAR